LNSATATAYTDLYRITLDDPRVAEIMSPDTTVTGTPGGFLEVGNIIYLDILPSYAATRGIELFFGRQQRYFTSSDAAIEPGIPLPFHELLALYAALDWNMVNRTDDGNLISMLQGRINQIEKDLKNFINMRNPSRAKMTMKPIIFR